MLPLVAAILAFTSTITIIGLSSFMVRTLNKASEAFEQLDTGVVTQLLDDWDTVPYTDIRINAGGSCPETAPEPIFSRYWAGTVEGCLATTTWFTDEVVTMQEYWDNKYECYWNGDRTECRGLYTYCNRIPPVPGITQVEFEGKTICGAQSGLSFKEMWRPDAQGNCPSGTKPCSSLTSATNTVCQSDADIAAGKCPILDIKIQTNRDAVPSGYTSRQIRDGLLLVFTKDYDSLPVTSTRVEWEPCANPDYYSASAEELPLYPLEIQNAIKCQLDLSSQKITDDRYMELDYNTSEYDVQAENNVFQVLTSLPDYLEEVDNAIARKQAERYMMWTRATIPWKLECDSNDRTREIVYNQVRDAAWAVPQNEEGAIHVARRLVICGLSFGIVFGIALILTTIFSGKDSNSPCRVVTIIFAALTLILQSILFGIAFKKAKESGADISAFAQQFDRLSVVNGCSDEYTHISQAMFDTVSQVGRDSKRMRTFSLVCLIFNIVFPLGTAVLVLLKNVDMSGGSSKSSKNYDKN